MQKAERGDQKVRKLKMAKEFEHTGATTTKRCKMIKRKQQMSGKLSFRLSVLFLCRWQGAFLHVTQGPIFS